MNLLKRLNGGNSRSYSIFSVLVCCVFLMSSYSTSDLTTVDDGEFVVVLDAGHGGHDPGNLGNGYLEKNIALKIVLKAGEILERTPGVKVVYTRKDDTFVDLYVRGEIANKAKADLFVSVHCDSHTSNANGAGTFVLGLHANKQNFEIAKKENSVIYLEDDYESRYADYDINSPESVIGLTIMQEEFLDQSIALAKNIQNNFSKKLKRKDRKVKQAGFIVLHQTFMPSVLIEAGFLTNDDEGAYLNSQKGQSQIGTAIAEAILSYKNGVQTNVSNVASNISKPTPEPDADGYDPFAEAKKTEDATQKKEETLEEAIDRGEIPTMKEVVSGKLDETKDSDKTKPEEQITPSVSKTVTKEETAETSSVNDGPVEQEVVVNPPSPQKKDKKPEKEVVNTAPAPKKIEEKKEVINTTTKTEEKKSTIVFKVQLLASTKDIPLKPENFKGLNKISKEPYKAFKRYMYGDTNSYQQAKLLKSNADAKGYNTSYIVAYKNGVRISVPEAIKQVSQ